jgi:hypothetical protein
MRHVSQTFTWNTQVASDQNFITWAVEESQMYARNGQPVYSYVFDYSNNELRNRSEFFGLIDGNCNLFLNNSILIYVYL